MAPAGPTAEFIAVVAPAHPSLTRGGAEIAAYTLYRGLREIGVAAIFVAACPEEDLHRLDLASHDEYGLATQAGRYEDFYTLAAAGVARQLREILLSRGVRIVNFHHQIHIGANCFADVAALPGVRYFVTFHDFTAICAHYGQMVTRPARALCDQASVERCNACYPERAPEQFALRRTQMLRALLPAQGYISPSRFLADRFIDWGLQAEKFSVIENGLAHPPAARTPARRHRRGEPFVFGLFGRITENKGLETLLDAIDLIADQPALRRSVGIRIHGVLSQQKDAFRARFAASLAAHDFVSYAGAYENHDVFELMAQCDYVLVPSIWWENSPLVMQEAFAAGRPVICTGIGGMAEKLRDGLNGFHVKRNDPADLVRVMARAADAALYRALSVPGARDGAAMARDYMQAFKKAGSSSFLKKRTKKLLPIGRATRARL
jgi:glycosyltransferase involved in cell wall biosynthesis